MTIPDSRPASLRAAVAKLDRPAAAAIAGPFIASIARQDPSLLKVRAAPSHDGFVVYLVGGHPEPRKRATLFFESDGAAMALVDRCGDTSVGDVCPSQAESVIARALRFVNDMGWEEP